MRELWVPWTSLVRTIGDRDVYLYGRSDDWVEKTVKKLVRHPRAIMDKNQSLWGTEFYDVPVISTDILLTLDKAHTFIVITTASYESVCSTLMAHGFQPGLHFCCSPDFADLAHLAKFKSSSTKLLLTSSDHDDPGRARSSAAGGGIFTYDVAERDLTRHVEGAFRQLAVRGDKIYAIEYVRMEMVILDLGLKVIARKRLDEPGCCGLEYVEEHDKFIIINSSNDTISILDGATLNVEETTYFSDKHKHDAPGGHHLNDVCYKDGFIYVSYFSFTGNFRKQVFDGGVTEIRFDDLGGARNEVYRDLWMPHSPMFIDDGLSVLDSMRGDLRTNTQHTAMNFDGFVRGLAFDGEFTYIGQSENMYYSRRSPTDPRGTMFNAGFYQVDLQTRTYRFYPLLDHSNVHDLMLLPHKPLHSLSSRWS